MTIPKLASRFNAHTYRYPSQRVGRPRQSPVQAFDGFCAKQVARVTTTITRLDKRRRAKLRDLYREEDWDPTNGAGRIPLVYRNAARRDADAEEGL